MFGSRYCTDEMNGRVRMDDMSGMQVTEFVRTGAYKHAATNAQVGPTARKLCLMSVFDWLVK
jgi:hypothetical protein